MDYLAHHSRRLLVQRDEATHRPLGDAIPASRLAHTMALPQRVVDGRPAFVRRQTLVGTAAAAAAAAAGAAGAAAAPAAAAVAAAVAAAAGGIDHR